jgi:metallo-beta-lactamase family protein
MKLTFWGAAGTVTGSMHEILIDGRRYLLDCGQYQGRRNEARERNSAFPFPPSSVEAVLLSHAHIDHSGNLPVLVKQGFGGPIYSSVATADLLVPMLADSAHLQEMDAVFLNKRLRRRRSIGELEADEEIEPIYTAQDVEHTYPLLHPLPMRTPYQVAPSLTYVSYDAGHMLGSTFMALDIGANGRKAQRPRSAAPNESGNSPEVPRGASPFCASSSKVRLGFSGDLGRPGLPIIRDPEPPPPLDYLILESTYGNRLHQELGPVKQKLAGIVNRTCARGGKIIVPAFAVGRTQQLVLVLHQLMNEQAIPSIPIFVDSPLAVNVTEVFRKHQELYDSEALLFLEQGQDPFGFSRLRYIRDVAESKALNDLRGSFVVISASGMCEAGRILHHLRNNIGDPRNTVLITGFQAENTLGRKIVDKQREVPIFGEPVRLRAEVAKINELSGHADQREILAWMKPAAAGLKRVFLVHGEGSQSAGLAKAIQDMYGVEVVIPAPGNSFELE